MTYIQILSATVRHYCDLNQGLYSISVPQALSAVLGQDATREYNEFEPVDTDLMLVLEVIPRSRDLNSNDGKQCTQPGCGLACPSGYVQMTGELAQVR